MKLIYILYFLIIIIFTTCKSNNYDHANDLEISLDYIVSNVNLIALDSSKNISLRLGLKIVNNTDKTKVLIFPVSSLNNKSKASLILNNKTDSINLNDFYPKNIIYILAKDTISHFLTISQDEILKKIKFKGNNKIELMNCMTEVFKNFKVVICIKKDDYKDFDIAKEYFINETKYIINCNNVHLRFVNIQ